MVLALSAVRHADEQFANPQTTPLSGAICTIGRSHECDIVLEDPTRHVSRKHVTISRQGDSYSLSVNSQINPVIVNGKPVSAGQPTELNAGDRIVIGEYEFSVVPASSAASVPGAARAEPSPANPASGPVDLDALFAPAAARPASKATPGDSMDALFAPAAPRPAPKAAPGDSMDAIFGAPMGPAADPLLDILGAGGGSRAAAPPSEKPHDEDHWIRALGSGNASHRPARNAADELLRGSGAGNTIDDLIGDGAGAATNPLGLGSDVYQVRSEGMFGAGTHGSLEIDHVHDVNLPLPMPSPTPAPAAPATVRAKPVPPRSPVPATPPPPATTTEPDPLAALFGPETAPSDAATQDPLGLFSSGTTPPPSPTRREEVGESKPQLAEARAGPRTSTAPADELPGLFGSDSAEPTVPAPQPGRPARSDLVGRSQTHPKEGVQATSVAQSAQTGGSAPQAVGSMQSAISAFLDGAGMSKVRIADADAEAFVRECGGTVRAAVEGVMEMLIARAKVKEELRASDRTMVASKENNALKLSETVEEALHYVFDPAARSDIFLPPPQAVADACSDLQAHEIALVAGMRSALMGAVKLFAPAVIEKKLEKDGGKSLLANKKAQLWDKFVAYYEDTEREAEENFDRVFGAAFLRAYQEQIRRLRE